jgi:hypothetical protein
MEVGGYALGFSALDLQFIVISNSPKEDVFNEISGVLLQKSIRDGDRRSKDH